MKINAKYFRRSLAIIGMLVTGGSAMAQQGTSVMTPGQTLFGVRNEYLMSAGTGANCVFQARMQADGNFVVYRMTPTGSIIGTLFRIPRVAGANAKLAFQTDGNLVVYSAGNASIWSTATQRSGGVKLELRGDGILRMTNSAGGAVWNSNGPVGGCSHVTPPPTPPTGAQGPQGPQGPQGIQGIPGVAGARAVVLTRTLAPGAVSPAGTCPTGGVEIESFTDVGADGLYSGPVDEPRGLRVVCNGAAGANGANGLTSIVVKSPIEPGVGSQCPAGGVEIKAFLDVDRSGGFTSGDTQQGAPSIICNGIKGDTGAAGAKGDTGADGARAVAVMRDIAPDAAGPCPTGGKLLQTWTDVVADRDGSGSPVFTSGGSITDLYLSEKAICNGAAGARGAGVVLTKSPADHCATGGSKITAYRDLNNNGQVDLDDPQMFDPVETCNGLRGADGFSSIIGSSTLPARSPECPTGGVKFDICLDTDRNGSCNAGDGGRSTPFVCNGANSVIKTAQNPAICGGVGGIEITSFTDVDNDGVESPLDTNVSTSFVCNGAKGDKGDQGVAGVNDVVAFANVADTTGRCAAGLIRVTTFTDANGSGSMDGGEIVKSTFDFCSGDSAVSRSVLMAEISNLVTQQVNGLRQEFMSSILSFGSEIGLMKAQIAELQGANANAQSQIQALLGRMATIEAQHANLQGQINGLNSELANQSSFIASLQQVVAGLTMDVANMQGELMAVQGSLSSKADAFELSIIYYNLQTQINVLNAQLGALQGSSSGGQSLVQRPIANAETSLCPLGAGGTEVSLCVLSGATCDQTKAISKVNVCNPAWQGLTISGVVRGLASNGLVLQNSGATQEVNLDFDGTNDVPFKFLVLPNQSYNITPKSLPAETECSVANGAGNTGLTNVTNVVVTCTGAWAGIKQVGAPFTNVFGFAGAVDDARNVFIGGMVSSNFDGQIKVGIYDALVTKFDASGAKQWTRLIGAANAFPQVYAVSTDPQGNVYIVGSIDQALDGQALTGRVDGFVTKFNANGVKQWTRLTGSAGTNSDARAIAIDHLGNVFMSGSTGGPMDGQPQTGGTDFFVIKYDSAGRKQWTRQMGSFGTSAVSRGLSVDQTGNIYVSGDVSGALDGVPLSGVSDVFVVKYSTAGVKQWTRLIGSAGANTSGGQIQIDRQGNLIVAGTTVGSLFYGEPLTGTGNNPFVAKLDSMGSRLWSRQLGVAGAFAITTGVSVDNLGNAFVTGYTNGGLDGNLRVGQTDAFVVKYNESGDKQWTRQIGGSGGATRGYGVGSDKIGNAFVMGYGNVGLDGKPKIGINDGFIAKFDANGVKK